jgi:hypothetical protein
MNRCSYAALQLGSNVLDLLLFASLIQSYFDMTVTIWILFYLCALVFSIFFSIIERVQRNQQLYIESSRGINVLNNFFTK